MAFGGSGGYAHLWATSATPRVNMASQPLDFPTLTAKPPRLTEQDSFALPFPYGVTQVCLSLMPLCLWHLPFEPLPRSHSGLTKHFSPLPPKGQITPDRVGNAKTWLRT